MNGGKRGGITADGVSDEMASSGRADDPCGIAGKTEDGAGTEIEAVAANEVEETAAEGDKAVAADAQGGGLAIIFSFG